jgi:hypothetical protein
VSRRKRSGQLGHDEGVGGEGIDVGEREVVRAVESEPHGIARRCARYGRVVEASLRAFLLATARVHLLRLGELMG